MLSPLILLRKHFSRVAARLLFAWLFLGTVSTATPSFPAAPRTATVSAPATFPSHSRYLSHDLELPRPLTEIPPAGHPKTYADVQAFLASDRTNELPYDVDRLNCKDFSELLARRARAQGFLAVVMYVTWAWEPDGHDFVAFYTADRGILWIEPQDDTEYDSHMNHPGLCWLDGVCWDGELWNIRPVWSE